MCDDYCLGSFPSCVAGTQVLVLSVFFNPFSCYRFFRVDDPRFAMRGRTMPFAINIENRDA